MYRYYPDELQHYGILGMKWGVRRYQNKDGTRTSLGKKRERADYKEDHRSKTKKTAKTAGKVGAAVVGGLLTRAAVNEARGKPEKHINREEAGKFFGEKDPRNNNKTGAQSINDDAQKLIEGFSRRKALKQEAERRGKYRGQANTMSDKELKQRVARLNLEKQYVDLSNQKATDGNWGYNQRVEYGRGVANDIVTYGVPLAIAGYKIYKKLR